MNEFLLGIKIYFREVPKISIVMWSIYACLFFFGGYKLYNVSSELFWAALFISVGYTGAGNVFDGSLKYVKHKVEQATAEEIFKNFSNED